MEPESLSINGKELLRMRKLLEKFCVSNEQQYDVLLEILEFLYKNLENNNHLENNNRIKKFKDKGLLDMDEVMKALRISRSTYFRLKKSGDLRPIKIGAKDCYSWEEVERFLNMKKIK